jgi:hypothetical protein
MTKRRNSPHPSTAEHVRSDVLEYLADLALELKAMAEQQHLPTLTGLLDLAHREALLQSGSRKSSLPPGSDGP